MFIVNNPMNYLEAKLLPLIEGIKPKQSESYTLSALGLERQSSQSILIAFGERIEQFWNTVISGSYSENLIEKTNLTSVNGKVRQIDHNFISQNDNVNYYLESKCNLNFDSEKIKASNKKINEVKTALNADVGAYFVPVLAEIPQKEVTKYNNKGLDVFGVNWLLTKIDAPFTSEEYFNFMRETVAPLLEKKGL
tara:strand:+ start:135 stop:716 length:582 start_codon:yes stop_codon:yes gene_type:complete